MRKIIILVSFALTLAIVMSGCEKTTFENSCCDDSTVSTGSQFLSSGQEEHGTNISQPCNISNEESDDENMVDIYPVYIYDFSDSISSVKHSVEYDFADRQRYDQQTVDDIVECLINGKEYVGRYEPSEYEYREFNYYPSRKYTTEDGIEFDLDERGSLAYCYLGNTTPMEEHKTQEECVAIAEKFLSAIVDIDEYDVIVEDQKEQERYEITFEKYINGMKTTDSAIVKVRYDGALYSFSSFMLGRVQVDLDSLQSIDIDKVGKSVETKLDREYAEAKKRFSCVEYSMPIMLLTTLKDGMPGVVCVVDVDCSNIVGKYKEVFPERIFMVVMIDQEESDSVLSE